MDSEFLQQPLNLAHFEDRKADEFLARDDFQQSIICHQRAHCHLRQVLFSLSSKQQKSMDSAFLTSLYSQLEYHIRQQSIILDKQKRAVNELKRQPYIASVREKATEALLSNRIQEHLLQHDSLLQSLKEQIEQGEQGYREGSPSQQLKEISLGTGIKKPKSQRDTLEELYKVNEQLRILVDELVTENITLMNGKSDVQADITLKIDENTFSCMSQSITSHQSDSEEGPIYSLPKALDLAPLEEPVFHVDEISDTP